MNKLKPLRICSFIPSSTEIITSLGLEYLITGVTFECHSDKPKIVRSILEENNYSSEEIENLVRESTLQNTSLYYIDQGLLEEASPDIIFSQDLCEVCQIGTSFIEEAINNLKKKPIVISLNPKNFSQVLGSIGLISKTLGFEENGKQLLKNLQFRIDRITEVLRKNAAPTKKVMLMEWIDPIYNCGHWIPDQINFAGGVDLLSNSGGYSSTIPWEKVLEYNPEILIIAPCGFKIKRSEKDLEFLTKLKGWHELHSVKNDQVYLLDGDLFTSPSTDLVMGIEILSFLFYPDSFNINPDWENRVKRLFHIHQEIYAS